MYRISDQTRYEEFLREAPDRLRGEVALLRTMIERAVRDEKFSLANSLLATLSKVSACHQQAEVRAGSLLEKAVALKLMKNLTTRLCEILRGYDLPCYERIVDRMTDDVDQVFKDTLKTQKQPLLLAAPEPTKGDADEIDR